MSSNNGGMYQTLHNRTKQIFPGSHQNQHAPSISDPHAVQKWTSHDYHTQIAPTGNFNIAGVVWHQSKRV